MQESLWVSKNISLSVKKPFKDKEVVDEITDICRLLFADFFLFFLSLELILFDLENFCFNYLLISLCIRNYLVLLGQLKKVYFSDILISALSRTLLIWFSAACCETSRLAGKKVNWNVLNVFVNPYQASVLFNTPPPVFWCVRGVWKGNIA